MGSYTTLTIDNHPVYSSKSYVNSEVMTIFTESDKSIFKRKFSERNFLEWGKCKPEDDFEEITYEYKATVASIIDRLEVMGFTLLKTEEDFNLSKKYLIEDLIDNLQDTDFSDLKNQYEKELKLLKLSNFNNFIDAFREIKKKQVPLGFYENFNLSSLALYIANCNGWILNYPSSNIRYYLRAFLESCSDSSLVIQDITCVTDAGYYSSGDNVRDIAVDSLVNNFEVNSKIIILTEGSSDKSMIERSLALLYPHLKDYYSFMDFGLANASGGASSLVAQIKGFIGVGIKNKIVAIFDNDTAAYTAKKGLNKTKIPNNISVIHYPDILIAKNYPTLGPTGAQSININGLAGSIEMYLGKDVLTESNELMPIKWKGYDDSLQKYQGELIDKTLIQKKYFKKLDDCEKNPKNIDKYDWLEMKSILNTIFSAFKT